MERQLQRLISAGVFAGLLVLAVRITGKSTRTAGDKVVFALIAGGFTVIGLLACLGAGFVITQVLASGGLSVGLVVAVGLLLAAGIALTGIGGGLSVTYRRKRRA